MDERRFLEDVTADRWTGVKFLSRGCGCPAHQPMRLCEAVAASFTNRIILVPEKVGCPGARRTLALGEDDETLARQMSQKTEIPIHYARQIIRDAPCLDRPLEAMLLGNVDDPDVLVGYLEPLAAMKILRLWQGHFGTSLQVELSGFLAVCSCMVAAAQLAQLCFSFGCPDSREYGGIPPNKPVVALRVDIAGKLAKRNVDHAHV